MANPSKAKGTAAETAVVDLAHRFGFVAERRALAGAADEGDVWIDHGRIVVECKARPKQGTCWIPTWNDIDIWMREAEREAQQSHLADAAVLVVKRNGYGAARAGDWFAWITAGDYAFISAANEVQVSHGYQGIPAAAAKQRMMMPLGDLFSAYAMGRRLWIPGGAP